MGVVLSVKTEKPKKRVSNAHSGTWQRLSNVLTTVGSTSHHRRNLVGEL